MASPPSPPDAPAASLPPVSSAPPELADAAPDASGMVLELLDPSALPAALLLLAGTVLVVRLLQRSVERVAERRAVHRLAIKQGATLLGFGAYALAAGVAVSWVVDFSAEAVLALSGVLAVAGGFLLKDVAESLFAGLAILTNRPFQVGDRITFGGHYGEVKEIGLRSVRLVTLDDNLVTIPSSKFLTEPVASANAGQLDCMVVIPFYVDPGADHERARDIVRDAVLSSRFLYLGKPLTVLLSMRLADQLGVVVEIVAKAYVFDARHEKSFSTDVTDRVLRAFRDAKVALPARAA